jgi:hypothetical protein
MYIKVHGGTPSSSEDNLCHTCRHSKITRGHKLDEETVICHASYHCATLIRFKVSSCSHYIDQRLPSPYELMEQAWILAPPNGKRPPGFVRGRDMREEEFSRYLADLRKSAEFDA